MVLGLSINQFAKVMLAITAPFSVTRTDDIIFLLPFFYVQNYEQGGQTGPSVSKP
jgi:hypothetical protein